MANRRMFSKSIIGSARFLRMPPSSRLLYYDLGMYADDDGVVEAFSVMRQTQATEDDLRVLVTKGFVTVLNDDLVTHITDWKENNLIRADRYQPSRYKYLILQLNNGTPSDNQMATIGKPSDNQRLTQDRLGKDSTGKDRLGEDSNEKPKKRFTPPTREEVQAYINEKGFSISADRFIDYYTANGWMVGKNHMKDWKATIRNWDRRNKGDSPNTQFAKEADELLDGIL